MLALAIIIIAPCISAPIACAFMRGANREPAPHYGERVGADRGAVQHFHGGK